MDAQKTPNLAVCELDPQKVLLSEVRYGENSKVNPEDKSNIFYKVAKDTAGGELKEGDLIKTSLRIFQTVELDGNMYMYTNIDEKIITIRKKDVNEEILSR